MAGHAGGAQKANPGSTSRGPIESWDGQKVTGSCGWLMYAQSCLLQGTATSMEKHRSLLAGLFSDEGDSLDEGEG